MPDRLVRAEVDLSAYKNNLEQIRSKLSSSTKLMAVVKANAYGHGLIETARAAVSYGSNFLGVVSLGELKKLRAAGIEAPILLLNYLDIPSFHEAITLEASVTVMDKTSIKELDQAAHKLNRQARVHLKVDSGMHRAGCSTDEALKLAKQIDSSQNLEFEGIFTHFADAENNDQTFTKKQLEIFKSVIEELKNAGIRPTLIHAANSAATLSLPESHFDMVRPGIITYGLNPFPDDHPLYEKTRTDFKPILSLKTQVVYLRHVKAGEYIGYGKAGIVKRPTTAALIPVGYGDGYRRSPYNAGKVLINGSYAPIIGNVSMDQTVIDVTDSGGVKIGDEVVLVGEQAGAALTAEDIDIAYRTINYEVVTALSERVARVYKV